MLASIGKYLTSMGVWGWLVSGVNVFSIVNLGFNLFNKPIFIFPTWGWLLFLIVGLLIAPFFAFHKINARLNELQKKSADPILRKKQEEHLDKIKNLISNWMKSLSVPRISEVMPGTTSDMDNVKNDVRFIYLKEHLPFNDLWQNFNDWDSNIKEYLDKCKALRDEIRESWKIDSTQATNSFADPILKMIDGEKLGFNFRITYDPELGEEEVSRQILIESGTEVVRGTLSQYAKAFKELGHYRCLSLTLGKEYQKLANEFLNQPLIAELKQLSSSLITKSRYIQESLWRILERADYRHPCKDCPIREETG